MNGPSSAGWSLYENIVNLFEPRLFFCFSLLFRYSRLAIPLHTPEAMELPTRPRVGRPPTFPFDHLLSKHVRHPIYPFAAAPAVSLSSVFGPFGVIECRSLLTCLICLSTFTLWCNYPFVRISFFFFRVTRNGSFSRLVHPIPVHCRVSLIDWLIAENRIGVDLYIAIGSEGASDDCIMGDFFLFPFLLLLLLLTVTAHLLPLLLLSYCCTYAISILPYRAGIYLREFCISLSHVLPFYHTTVAVFWLSSHIADMADWTRMHIRSTESTEYSVNGIQGPLHSIQTLLCIAAARSYDSSLLIRMIMYDLLICHTEYGRKLSWVVRFDTSSALLDYVSIASDAMELLTLLQLRLVKPSTRNSAIHHGMGYGWCKFTASHQPVNNISVGCLQGPTTLSFLLP